MKDYDLPSFRPTKRVQTESQSELSGEATDERSATRAETKPRREFMCVVTEALKPVFSGASQVFLIHNPYA